MIDTSLYQGIDSHSLVKCPKVISQRLDHAGTVTTNDLFRNLVPGMGQASGAMIEAALEGVTHKYVCAAPGCSAQITMDDEKKTQHTVYLRGRDQGGYTALALGFTRERTPAVSTPHRVVFSNLDRESSERALGCWLQGQGLRHTEAVAVDGKTLRGIHGEEVPGVHLVAAYAHQSDVVVGQQAVGEKENELAALPGLLGQLDLEGRVLTGDAQFTQRRECRQMVAKGGTTFSR